MARVIDAKEVLLYCFTAIIIWNGVLYTKNKTIRKKQAWLSAFISYIAVIMAFTLLPILVPPMFTEELQYNIDVRYLFTILSDRASLINIAGNVMLFVPISVLGHLAGVGLFKEAKGACLGSFAMSACIEFLQGVETYLGLADFPAVVDINDLITNTLGGVLGYYLIVSYLKKERTTN